MKKALIALLMGLMALPAIATNTNSIVENLQELIEARDAITNAIVERGGSVISGALKDVPQEILDIPDPPSPSPPVLIDKIIRANGTYYPAEDNADGYNEVTAAIPTNTLGVATFTSNATYQASADGVDGYSSVTVNVSPQPVASKLPEIVTRQSSPTWTLSANDLSGCTKIGGYAFSNCGGLTSVTLPSTVTSIQDYGFYYCTKLESVTIPEGVTYIGSNAFYFDSALTSITIPSTVTSIGNSAFSGCSKLTSINIPDGVTTIQTSTFQSCSRLATIDFGSTRNTIPTLGNVNAFSYIANGYRILVPSSLVSTWKAAGNWSSLASHIYPHIDFDPSTTYVVNAQGEVVYEDLVSGRLTNDTIDDWLNSGMVQADGTETVVIGLDVQNITADSDYLEPSLFQKLEFLDRTSSDISGWSNYPWNYSVNSTLLFLDSSVDHTIK